MVITHLPNRGKLKVEPVFCAGSTFFRQMFDVLAVI